MVTMITFFGSIFAIMTYNEDVDVNGVFDRLYTVLTEVSAWRREYWKLLTQRALLLALFCF